MKHLMLNDPSIDEYLKTITSGTTLAELYGKRLISTRVYNALTRAEITNVFELWDLLDSGANICKFRYFGVTSEAEVRQLVDKIVSCSSINLKKEKYEALDAETRDCFELAFYQTICLDSNVEVYLHKQYPEPYLLYHEYLRTPNNRFRVISEFTEWENWVLRRWYQSFYQRYDQELEALAGNRSEQETMEDGDCYSLKGPNKAKSSEDLSLDHLPDYKRGYIAMAYRDLCRKRLGKREIHFLERFTKSYEDLVHLFGKPLDSYQKLCYGCNMIKTVQRIYEFNKEFEEFCLKVVPEMSKEEVEDAEIKLIYPYLSYEERTFVREFFDRYGYRPLFYMLIAYIKSSTDRNHVIFRLYSGIDGNPMKSEEEIGSMFGLSQAMVKCIVAVQLKKLNGIIFTDEDLSQYKTFFNLPFITERSPEFLTIMQTENLTCCFGAFSLLVRSMSDFKFSQDSLYKGILFSQDMFNDMNLAEIRNNLHDVVKGKYFEDTKVYVEDIAGSVPEKHSIAVNNLLIYLAEKIYGMKAIDGEYFLMCRNAVDIEAEIISILEKGGKPMNIDRLFEVFKQKFPDHRFKCSKQLAVQLRLSKKVQCIGFTGNYALKEWKNVYFGSMLQLAYDVLAASEQPMHLDEIMQKIHEIYPNAKWKHIKTMMNSDYKHRFVAFEDLYFGISGREYVDSCKLQKQLTLSELFETRLEQFKNFVETNHRYPLEKTERVLCKWHKRLIKDSPNKENKQRLMEVEKSFEKYRYPRNCQEYEFLCRCESYKESLMQYRRMKNLEKEEFKTWFYRHKRQYEGYSDFRKYYFEDFLNFLNENKLLKKMNIKV